MAEKLPESWADRAQDSYVAARFNSMRRARRAFERADPIPSCLTAQDLERMAARYQPPTDYGYDPKTTERRGNQRARRILSLPGIDGATSFLEVGCWDGMVCAALQNSGKVTTGVDTRDTGFDDRARSVGVNLRCMDAEALDIPDNAFDVAFSYDTFEHFKHPDRVLTELIRVVRPGGLLWVEFGPLYLSAFGAHLYRIIPVPYCHILWSEEVLSDFSARLGLAIDLSDVNRWRVHQFRELFDSEALKPIIYREGRQVDHLNLIASYPACFRSITKNFDEFVIHSFRALYRIR